MSLNVIRIFFLNITDRDFPTIHLILVSTNGTVWDISLNENISPSKKKILKLPNSCLYHGYSDDKGIVYFINGNLQKNIIKYHKSFKRNAGKDYIKGEKAFNKKVFGVNDNGFTNQNGDAHMSLNYDPFCYTQSLLFGNYFWLFGKRHGSIFDQVANSYCKLRSLCKVAVSINDLCIVHCSYGT